VTVTVTTTPTEQKRKDGLDYVSKSRIKTFKTCPRKFYLKYWCENRPPSTEAIDRGSEIHEMLEAYHENLVKYVDRIGKHPDDWWRLLPDWSTLEFLDPYIGNFWKFESRRREASPDLQTYLPESVEESQRIEDPPSGDIPWIGTADAVIRSATLPSIEGDGVVILDYKTGDVPDERYREEGIYLEQEFYAMLFEDKYDVDGVAAYYPRHDELLEAELSHERRERVKQAAVELQQEPEEGNFPIDEQPLCSYGHGACFFHKHGDSEGRPCLSGWKVDEPVSPPTNKGSRYD
jgi:CRISPR/Cas system-associated exonuclease Cas4 (RecB family)